MIVSFKRAIPAAAIALMFAVSFSACNGGGSSNAPVGPQIVSVAGDSEADVTRAITASERAGKTVRYVTVQSATQKHVFPPYAQILHTSASLIVRAYSRMYVWPSNAITVTYSASPHALDLSTLPLVTASDIDTAAKSYLQTGTPTRSALGKSLCADCALLLGKPRKRKNPDPWQGLEDPWQQNPDYAYWQASDAKSNAMSASGSAGRRKAAGIGRPCLDPGVGECKSIDGGYYYYYYNPEPEPPAPAPTPLIATIAETPSDPDGPGNGPIPNLSQPQISACPANYFLAIEESTGPQPGGYFCAVDFSSVNPGSMGTTSEQPPYVVRFQDEHFWNRHLACYLHQQFTKLSYENDVIIQDFDLRMDKPTTTNSVQFQVSGVPDDNNVSSTIAYRVANISSLVGGIVTVYNVGTSFFVPERQDCPKPYPNYP